MCWTYAAHIYIYIITCCICCGVCTPVPEQDTRHWCADMESIWNQANLCHLAVAEAHPFAAFVGT